MRIVNRARPHHSHHGHSHMHHTGFKGWLYELFVPHTHDSADSIDDALESSVQGVRALKISLFMLLGTTILQFLVVLVSGSVALLADTIHNLSDALTAVPLWIAFILGRRAATRRYTYGYGRAEDLAGLFIVAVVAFSAVVAAWQSIDRLFHPQPLHNLWWVLAAGVIGFAGNEAVAVYRIRVGRQIGFRQHWWPTASTPASMGSRPSPWSLVRAVSCSASRWRTRSWACSFPPRSSSCCGVRCAASAAG